MREKDLKIKKPKRELKTLDKNFKMKAVQRKFLIDKFKSDKNREDETVMSEASNNAQDEFEDIFISTGLYAAEKFPLNNIKKKTKQNEQTNNFKRNVRCIGRLYYKQKRISYFLLQKAKLLYR